MERLVLPRRFLRRHAVPLLAALTTFLLWEAVYASRHDEIGDDQIAGFHRDRMIAYLLLVQVSPDVSPACRGWPNGIAR